MLSARFPYSAWARFVTVVFIGVLCFIAAPTTHVAYAGEPAKQDAVSATSTIGISSADLDADELPPRWIRIFRATSIALMSLEWLLP